MVLEKWSENFNQKTIYTQAIESCEKVGIEKSRFLITKALWWCINMKNDTYNILWFLAKIGLDDKYYAHISSKVSEDHRLNKNEFIHWLKNDFEDYYKNKGTI